MTRVGSPKEEAPVCELVGLIGKEVSVPVVPGVTVFSGGSPRGSMQSSGGGGDSDRGSGSRSRATPLRAHVMTLWATLLALVTTVVTYGKYFPHRHSYDITDVIMRTSKVKGG